MTNWARDLRRAMARLPRMRLARIPDAPALPVRDPWPGDPARGARLLRGDLVADGAAIALRPGNWASIAADPALARSDLAGGAHGFAWLRDLRALGTDSARLRARALVADWIATAPHLPLASRPDIAGARITAWLAHYDFFAASADDVFRQRLMGRLVVDARTLSADLPAEQIDARALTALKGLIAAAVALPDHTGYLTRGLRFLAPELARQVSADGCHVERSPAVLLSALQDLVEIRALLQASQTASPLALVSAIDRMAPALRTLRHGDGGLALFNGSTEGDVGLIDLVLSQAGRSGRAVAGLTESGFHRVQAGRSVLLVDCGAPPPPGLDRLAHAGTLSIELSIGRDRMIVNCGALVGGGTEWQAATRATAAHSTLVIADTSSSELTASGLGRRPGRVEVQRQESMGAHWLEASHDGWQRPFGALHRRRLYVATSGEDIRGEDVIEAATPQPWTIRFHLHPGVVASLQHDHEAVLLRLPGGSGWRLRADGPRMTLEESVYLGGPEPRRSEQVVLSSFADGPQHVKWAITKVG